jgi:uncharacterized membrane protein HdeD (DUF308 family)
MEALWKIAAPTSIALTLATWLFFKYSAATDSAPLGAAELTFFFAVWFVATLAVRWLWRFFANKRAGGSSHEAPKS